MLLENKQDHINNLKNEISYFENMTDEEYSLLYKREYLKENIKKYSFGSDDQIKSRLEGIDIMDEYAINAIFYNDGRSPFNPKYQKMIKEEYDRLQKIELSKGLIDKSYNIDNNNYIFNFRCHYNNKCEIIFNLNEKNTIHFNLIEYSLEPKSEFTLPIKTTFNKEHISLIIKLMNQFIENENNYLSYIDEFDDDLLTSKYHSDRGLSYYHFRDVNDVECTIQDSSSVNPTIWFRLNGAGLLFDVNEVTDLIDLFNYFLKYDTLPNPNENEDFKKWNYNNLNNKYNNYEL